MIASGETSVRALTAQIISAYVKNNEITRQEMVVLIREVYNTLIGIVNAPASVGRKIPAVSPKKSVYPDYIVCLEDGKKLKLLRRHLQTVYNLTPQAYRERWGLPPEYPMVAPNYARRRSSLARSIGLGRKR